MKVKAKVKDCQLIVKVKTSFGDAIDEQELNRFARVFLRGFLKPKQVKKNLVEYIGPVGVSLYERLKNPITKREFLFILEQIVLAVQKLQANQIPLDSLVLTMQNVYINEVTKEVQFLYVPTCKKQIHADVAEFIEAVVYSVKPGDEKDNDFTSRFVYYFRALDPFDINKIEKFVLKEDRSVVNTIKKQNAGQSGFMTDKPLHYYDHYNGADDDDEPTGLLDDDEPTGLLNEDEDEATGLLSENDEETGLLSEDEDGTALLNDSGMAAQYPTLYRVLTEERIVVDKLVYRLGKEQSCVDYFVTNNIAVSRSHADIITRGNKYYVKDLNSKNHTYINGQELPVHCEVEIHDGDNLRLGNEEFVFNT